MDGHEIRLRGGWECLPVEAPGSETMRLALPIASALLPGGRLRLTRRFNRPPRAAGADVVLRVAGSPGIRSVRLNGRTIGPTSPGGEGWDASLRPLAPRNELVIEAEPPRGDADWGMVSLIFR